MAACTGDSNGIRILVNKEEFPPSHEFQQGVTALHEACEAGHTECVEVLVELGANVNKQVEVECGSVSIHRMKLFYFAYFIYMPLINCHQRVGRLSM